MRTPEYVLESMGRVAPQAVGQLLEAEIAVTEGGPERLSHAVLSCRRALKSLADALYSPPSEPVVGTDGVRRALTDAEYISRLWQFASEAVGGRKAGEVIRTSLDDLGRRIDAVYGAVNKGVHDVVTEAEAYQFVTQTLMVSADLLRLHDRSSAVEVELQDDVPAPAPVQVPSNPPPRPSPGETV